jgi:uroporphyrinogen decarboxylase
MKPREIILKAFEGGKPERVPATLFGGGMWSIKDFGTTFEELSTNSKKMSDMLIKESERLLCDIVYAGSGYNNFHASAFGGKMKFREMGAPDLEDHLIDSAEALDGFDLSSLDKSEVIRIVEEALKVAKDKLGGEYVVTMTAWGPFTLAGRFLGEEAMMKGTFKKADLVHKVVDFCADLLIHLYEPLVKDGTIDVISLADPTASGDLISKKQFKDFAVPYLKKFTDWAKGQNVHTLVHICGNTTDRVELMPDTGASCISLDHKTDMIRAKEELHGKMCFAGNVDPVAIMLQGTPEQVESTCKSVIEKVGTDGGFVLMPGCDIPPTVPYENIQKFMQTAREWKL